MAKKIFFRNLFIISKKIALSIFLNFFLFLKLTKKIFFCQSVEGPLSIRTELLKIIITVIHFSSSFSIVSFFFIFFFVVKTMIRNENFKHKKNWIYETRRNFFIFVSARRRLRLVLRFPKKNKKKNENVKRRFGGKLLIYSKKDYNMVLPVS